MSIKVMSWYWDHSKQEGHKLLLLLALADWANEDGECFPSMGGLAKRSRRDKRSVQRTIKELEASGEILVYQGMGKGQDGQRSPLYYLLKYRHANSIHIPPMIIEAAQYYREQSRKQGKKGIEVRKAQAALLDQQEGVTPVTPPTGDVDVTPTGDASDTPTGDVDVTQIRQLDPSLDPSEKREGESLDPLTSKSDPSPTPQPPPAQLATPMIELAEKVAEATSYDPPKPSKPAVSVKPARQQAPLPESIHFDGRKFKGGFIPAGKGATAVEVYYEAFSIRDNDARLTEPNEEDLTNLCPDLDRLRTAVTAYRRSGNYRKGNLQLILDWYNGGVPSHKPTTYANGAAKPATATADLTFKQWLLKQYHTNVVAAIIRGTSKTERDLRNEYEQWITTGVGQRTS